MNIPIHLIPDALRIVGHLGPACKKLVAAKRKSSPGGARLTKREKREIWMALFDEADDLVDDLEKFDIGMTPKARERLR